MQEITTAMLRDDRYKNFSLHDLLTYRANLINSHSHDPQSVRYDLALIQYWIMIKDGRIEPTV